jgi:AraC-like DNA-binding protein
MARFLTGEQAAGLERSCTGTARDFIRLAPDAPGFERIEAFFSGHAFDPHRHDTYALGATLSGVQTFRYRGARQDSVSGHVIALHPDEVHDGEAGAAGGFAYRMLYLAPDLVAAALAGRAGSLPFAGAAAVSRDRGLATALAAALGDLEREPEPLERDQMVLAISEALLALDPSAATGPGEEASCARAVSLARDYLMANALGAVDSADLERETGLDRFRLARHFRRLCGTSPHRFLTLRRLDHARALIAPRSGLADAAADSGFADQAHMTRHFRSAYGLTPGRYRAMRAAG